MNRTNKLACSISGRTVVMLGTLFTLLLCTTLAQARTEESSKEDVSVTEADVVVETPVITDPELTKVYEEMPARRKSVRATESAFTAAVAENGPPTAKLSIDEQEQLMQRVNSATLKMQSLLDGVLATASEAERLAYRISSERNVVMEDIILKIGDARTLLSETQGDIVVFSNLASLMLLSDDPLSLSSDVQEAAKIVHDQLFASRDTLIKVTTVLMQNSVVPVQQ